jgi:hypothetical protein
VVVTTWPVPRATAPTHEATTTENTTTARARLDANRGIPSCVGSDRARL